MSIESYHKNMFFINKFTLKIAFVVTLILLVAWIFSSIVLYLTVSIVLATIMKPMMNAITHFRFFNFRIPRVLAILMSFSVLLLILSLLVVTFVPLVSTQLELVGQLKVDKMLAAIEEPLVHLEQFLIEKRLVNKEEGFIIDAIEARFIYDLGDVNMSKVLNNFIHFTSSFFVGLLAVTFITFFLLYEKGILKRLFLSMVPNAYFELTIAAFYKIEILLTNYLMGLLLQTFAIFTLTSTGLTIVGIPYAFTVGVFAAFINVIPYVGPFIGSVVAIVVGLTTAPTDWNGEQYGFLILQIGIVSTVVHLIDNIALQPLIFSKTVKAHPLEIFVAIFAGAAVAGIVGMVVAIPVYTVLRVSVTELGNGYKRYRVFSRYQKTIF